MKAPLLLWLFFVLPYSLFGQKLDFTPYIGPNISFSSILLTKNTKTISPYESAAYSSKGKGLDNQSILYSGGFYLGILNKKGFGFQSGVRFARISNGFISEEFLANKFTHKVGYTIKSNKIDLPFHLVYDIHKSNKDGDKMKSSKFIRLFIGPVFSFSVNSQSFIGKTDMVMEDDGILLSTYESKFVVNKNWQGIEAGINVNPIYKGILSLGLLFHYNISPLGHVNYTSSVGYSSKTTHVSDETIGGVSLKGGNLMLQIGIKPIILK